MKIISFSILLVSAISVVLAQNPTIEYVGQNVTLNLYDASMEVDNSLASRISSLKLNGEELLFQKNGSNDAFGSTFWYAPQSAWNWPPPTALNNNAYTVTSNSSESFTAASSIDQSSGLRFSKSYGFDTLNSFFSIQYMITNTGQSSKDVAPWEVTRFPSGGMAFFPQRKEGESTTGDLASQVEDINGVSWFDYDSTNIPSGVPKYFSDGTEGWLAYVTLDGQLVVKKFDDTPPELRATNNENEIELYVNPDRTYYEVEQQGEYQTLESGESLEWEVQWIVRQIPSHIKIEKGNLELADYVRDIFNNTIIGTENTVEIAEFRVLNNQLIMPNDLDNEIHIYNVTGQEVVISSDASGYGTTIELSDLSEGIYIVKSTKYKSFKFIK